MRRVLILNRRCIRHPQRGGAEVYTFEIAKAFVDRGMNVKWFSSKPKNTEASEVVDGIEFIRKGNELSVHFYGFLHALFNRYELVIDEFNGVGFFCFLCKNSVTLIHQLYDEFWRVELGVVGFVFRYIERLLLSFYKKRPTITVSPSTAMDLKRLGFSEICIVPNGLNISPSDSVPEKPERLTLMFLGRLKKTKKPEDAIRAFLIVKKRVRDAVLYVVGDGPCRVSLEKRYGCRDIIFTGFVPEKKKFELLKRSHFLLVPGVREGWGQVVIQANAVGVPAVGYNIAGLRDSIRDGKTGILVKNFREMAEAIVNYYMDKEKYQNLCINALKYSRLFSWDETRDRFISCLRRWGIV